MDHIANVKYLPTETNYEKEVSIVQNSKDDLDLAPTSDSVSLVSKDHAERIDKLELIIIICKKLLDM